jgi:ribosomal protein L33
MSCQEHIIGICGGTKITSFDEPVVTRFLNNLAVFTTSKKQINHPGFMILAKYCPECGAAINYKKIKPQWDVLIESAINRDN